MIIAVKLLSSIVLLLVFMYTRAFQQNKAMGRHAPGFGKRFNIYFNSHVSETSDNPILPEMITPRFTYSRDELFTRLEKGITNLGWIIVSKDPETREIKAIVQSKLFKFKDDIIVRADRDGGNASKLYAYSSSRIGIGDMGANQKHIMDLLEQIK